MGARPTAYKLGQETSGSPASARGWAASPRRGAAAATERAIRRPRRRRRARPRAAFDAGASGGRPVRRGAGRGGGARNGRGGCAPNRPRAITASGVQALREGDRGGAAATPDIKEKED
jgi:type IV secretion system protein TrbL